MSGLRKKINKATGLMLTCYTLQCTVMVILCNFTLLLKPLEQTLITQTQGLSACNITEFC